MSSRRRTALVLAVVLVLVSALAVLVDGEAIDTVLGFAAGGTTAFLSACLAGAVLERQSLRRCADSDRLDALEPLSAARRDGP